jgi:hypothetical protein
MSKLASSHYIVAVDLQSNFGDPEDESRLSVLCAAGD